MKYRSRSEIIAVILETVNDSGGVNKTRIMYKAILFIAVLLTPQVLLAQDGNTLKICVQNKDTKENTKKYIIGRNLR